MFVETKQRQLNDDPAIFVGLILRRSFLLHLHLLVIVGVVLSIVLRILVVLLVIAGGFQVLIHRRNDIWSSKNTNSLTLVLLDETVNHTHVSILTGIVEVQNDLGNLHVISHEITTSWSLPSSKLQLNVSSISPNRKSEISSL